jgi:HNH endonuclease
VAVVIDLFGGTIIEGYDPHDMALPCGLNFNELKEELEVNVEEGWAKRRKDAWTGTNYQVLMARAGELVDTRRTKIKGKSIPTSHIIWCFANDGKWPEGIIDHKNGDQKNNSISNLRDVTYQNNSMNMQLKINNTSGTTGVYWKHHNKKWIAQIMIFKKCIYLGSFKNFDDAVAARYDAEDKYFGEYSRRASRGDHYKEPDPERLKQLWG